MSTVCGKKNDDSIPAPKESSATPSILQTFLVLFIRASRIILLHYKYIRADVFMTHLYDSIFIILIFIDSKNSGVYNKIKVRKLMQVHLSALPTRFSIGG